MRFDIITLFPQALQAWCDFGVVGRGKKEKRLEIHCWTPRQHSERADKRIDDKPYGGGPGMIMQAEPLCRTLEEVKQDSAEPALSIGLSPHGLPLTQALVEQLAEQKRLILICGRYEGIDERFMSQAIDFSLSVGDYILTGGELAALIVIEAVGRLQRGILGSPDSAQQESFDGSGLLDHPHYTRPAQWRGDSAVPSVLLSGDHRAIEQWRLKQRLGQTWLHRPDLLAKLTLNAYHEQLLQDFISEYFDNRSHENVCTDTSI